MKRDDRMLTEIKWPVADQYLYLIGAILVVVFFTLVLIIFSTMTKKGKFLKKYNQAKKEYLDLTKLPISDALSKLEGLAMRNFSFSKLLAMFTNRFMDYNDRYLQAINTKLEEMKSLIDDSQYPKANTAYEGLLVMLQAFSKEYNQLYKDILEATSKEDNLKDKVFQYKNEYIRCQKLYNSCANDLSIVSTKIKGLFKRTESMIEECEDNIAAGIYHETEDLFKQIEADLDYLNSYLIKMPSLIKITTEGIVKELNLLIDKNNIMQAEYPLHHLMPIKKIEVLRGKVNDCLAKIKEFDYEGLEYHLDELKNDIHQLSMDLDKERMARKEYDEGCENLYILSDCTSRNYVKMVKEAEKLQSTYATTPEFDEFKRISRQYYEQLSEARKKVDNNVYGHQPFSMRLKNMHDLEALSKNFQTHLDTFNLIAEQLCTTAENCFNNIDYYIALIKKTRIIIENCNVLAFTKKYIEKIKVCEEMLTDLVNALKTPIRLTLAKELVVKLNKECKELYGSAVYQEKLMNYCERIIVMAARQRMSFQNVEYGVNRASFYFNEGDFEAARYTIEKLNNYNINLPSFEENVQMVK